MEHLHQLFAAHGEPYAAGFYEDDTRDRFWRFAHAQRLFWQNVQLPDYDGGLLYPCGAKFAEYHGVGPQFSYTWYVDEGRLRQKGVPVEAIAALHEECALLRCPPPPHDVAGSGYTHSIPHYERVLREGLDSYLTRVQALPEGDFRDGLLEVIVGIRAYRDRLADVLRRHPQSENRDTLLAAYEQVPFAPARSLAEAIIGWNFLYYVDGCDNAGRLDAGLLPFDDGMPQDALESYLRALFTNVDKTESWSAAIGPECSRITLACLRAIRGMRRPNLELRVTEDTPDEIWKAAAEAIATGCGQPALYNEQGYQDGLHRLFPEIPAEDLYRFNGGGCTETMLAGLSNVGSLDAGINLPLILSRTMRERLAGCPDFEGFYQALLADIRRDVSATLLEVNRYRQERARVRPQPVRTLLIDDCIDRGLDFNAGGARYNWSVINLAGVINCADGLLALRELVYGGNWSSEDFLTALEHGDPALLTAIRRCPHYGVDDEDADALAARFAGDVWGMMELHTPYLGGKFLASSIQFSTCADAGRCVPATPDGRSPGDALADSLAALHGRDTQGLTAMLCSVARLPQQKALGTPVVNVRMQKRLIQEHLRPIVLGYFAQGGLQLQVNCVSRADMLDAIAHPERHGSLIVRVGGYAEYFTRLTPELQHNVLARTEFGED